MDILLDVNGGVESALLEGCPRTTTGVSQHWFSGHFRQVFFNTNALPRINIGANVWGESSIMTRDIIAGACLLCTSDEVCVIVYGLVLVCRGRHGFFWGVSSLQCLFLKEQIKDSIIFWD